ncbi:MAG: hypothetical protein ACK56F_28830, partial [bacterium]
GGAPGVRREVPGGVLEVVAGTIRPSADGHVAVVVGRARRGLQVVVAPHLLARVRVDEDARHARGLGAIDAAKLHGPHQVILAGVPEDVELGGRVVRQGAPAEAALGDRDLDGLIGRVQRLRIDRQPADQRVGDGVGG